MNMLIDFHTHLLPGMDDGSQSVAESMDMLEALRLQKVDIAIATPHFYSHKTNLTDFLQLRESAFAALQAQRSQLAPKVILGAEVSFFRGIGKAGRIAELTVEGTNLLLLEMPFAQWGRSEISEIYHLLDRDITPVIAHVERYYSFQKDLTAFNEIVNLPVALQINTEALLSRKTRRLAQKLIAQDFCVVLGTDCHNMKKRKPNMDARQILAEHKNADAVLEKIDARSTKLLNINE